MIANFWKKLKKSFVDDLPVELDACEMCRKTECSHGHWTECETRIAHAQRLEIDRAKQRDSR